MGKAHLLQGTCLCRSAVLALGVVAVPGLALAAPTGGVVSGGSAVISQSGNKTDIHQSSDRAVLDWQGFDIGAGEHTQFYQPSSSSIALNRIHSGSASQILGQLTANGTVVLVNPNGVLFGAGSQVNVGSLVATTADTDNDRFMAGGELVFDIVGNPEASIVNEGTITARDAGLVALVAPSVVNNGIIQAKLGKVQLSSGDTMTVDLYGDGLINVAVSEAVQQQFVANNGTINAEGGTIVMTAETAAQMTSSLINLKGTLNASSETGSGGHIYITGDNITVEDGARIHADGRTGGGTVHIGGEYQGGGETYRADTVSVEDNTLITANALYNGDGGEVIVWADDTTNFAGTIEAKGGSEGGNGGFIETSGKKYLHVADSARVTTLAPFGLNGQWLLDPQDFTIAASGGDITGATLTANLAGGNVTILSSNGGTAGNGDINVNDTISWSNNLLTLTAARDININSVMTATGSAALTMNTATTNGADTGVTGGVVRVGMYTEGEGGGFKGRVDYSASGALIINGTTYTVINSLGAEGSTTGTDLQGINGALTGNYVLGSNIDASATSTWNAGAGFDPLGDISTRFNGKFNGLGHTITGLTINRGGENYVGLFGAAAHSISLSNVGLVSAAITGQSYVGALFGGNETNGSSIYNSYSTGSVTGNSGGTYVGGLIGYAHGAVSVASYLNSTATVSGGTYVGGLAGMMRFSSGLTNSYATGDVSGAVQYVGGLNGYNYSSNMDNVYATGNVSNTGNYTGGLSGFARSSTINNAYATGTVSGARITGGLIGQIYGNLVVTNSYATGAVTGTDQFTGGLIGNTTSTDSLSNVYATGTVDGVAKTGGLVGSNSGTIQNSYATGNVTGTSETGGLVGSSENGSIITGSYAAGTVDGTSYVGGLVGDGGGSSSLYTTITDSYATGAVNASVSIAGGLIGGAAKVNMSNVYATGTVTSAGNYAGGLIGYTYTGASTITNSYATGTVTSAGNYAGGLLGYTYSGASTITDSYATGAVSGVNYTGGLVGRFSLASTITNSYATGTVNGATYVGGLTGYLENDAIIASSYATGAVTATGDYAGGLVGIIIHTGTTITDSYATGDVSGGERNGGLVGRNVGTIIKSYATGNVTGVTDYIGGLVGLQEGGSVSKSYATGTADGRNNVGGLFGTLASSTITDSYATGAATGTSYVGGFSGKNLSTGSVARSYSIGAVSGGINSGGFIGQNLGTVTNSFWNTETSGWATSEAGTGLTTAQMKDSSTFSGAGWDLDTVWALRDYVNNGYPVLRDFFTNVDVTLLQSTSKTYGDANPALALGTDYSISGCSGCVTLGVGSGLTSASNTGTYNYGNGATEGTSNLFALTINSGTLSDYIIDYDYGDGSLNMIVDKATLTVSIGNASKTYGDANPSLSGSITGFKLSDTIGVLDSLPTYATAATQSSDAGTYAITGSGGADGNYSFNYVNGTLTVNKADLNVSLTGSYSRKKGAGNPDFNLSYSGFKLGESKNVLNNLPAATSAANSNSAVGTYSILLSGGSDNNYNLVFTNPVGTLEVTSNISDTVLPTSVTRSIAHPKPTIPLMLLNAKDTPRFLTTDNVISKPIDVPINMNGNGLESFYQPAAGEDIPPLIKTKHLNDTLSFDPSLDRVNG